MEKQSIGNDMVVQQRKGEPRISMAKQRQSTECSEQYSTGEEMGCFGKEKTAATCAGKERQFCVMAENGIEMSCMGYAKE